MKFLISLCLVGYTLCPAVSRAALLDSTFAGGNGLDGNFFNVVVTNATNSIKITEIGIHANNLTSENFSLYTKSGTYVGSELTSGDWGGSHFSGIVAGAAGSDGTVSHGVVTTIDIPDLILSASSTTGFFAIFDGNIANDNFLNFTNNGTTATVDNVGSDSNLEIQSGTSINGLFTGTTQAGRTANIRITYEVLSSGAVPEPASLAAFGLFGLALIRHRRRKNK